MARSGKRILVVDDETDVMLTLKVCLEEYGFMVDGFNDPIPALKNFKAEMYDLLLLDIKMPEMNGLELYKEIKKQDNEVKVCFFTAGETYNATYAEIYNTLGVECFIQKPIATEALIKRIGNILVST